MPTLTALLVLSAPLASGLRTLSDVLDALGPKDVVGSIARGASWLANTSQIHTAELPANCDDATYEAYRGRWRGGFRGEYQVGGKFGFFGPVWHAGQAIKALVLAMRAVPTYDPTLDVSAWLECAKLATEFILEKQITSGPDAGLLFAIESVGSYGPPHMDMPCTATQLECLDGLFELADYTRNASLGKRAIATARWLRDNAYVWRPNEPGAHGRQPPDGSFVDRGYNYSGLLYDLYNLSGRAWDTSLHGNPAAGQPGRPLLDNAIMLKASRRTGEQAYRDAFYATAERLLADEAPRGNWGAYLPCTGVRGVIHPRQAYWWGLPLLDAYEDSGDARYLAAASRAGRWYIDAQRSDGGMFRHTTFDFETSTFGQVTSASACAVALWIRLFQLTHDTALLPPMLAALRFVRASHFGELTSDANLRGAVLEKSVPPVASCDARGACEATDASPYYLRDIATSFYLQALSLLLEGAAKESTHPTTPDSPTGAQG